jgi:Zn-dependent protease
MFRSWKLGTAFGIGIYVHWTFLLLLAWVFLTNAGGGHTELALFAVSLVVCVFGCVILHELGHALMARRFGIPTQDITLYPIGGVARLTRMSERPWEEFWIAIAGPAVNVVIALFLTGLLALTGNGLDDPERVLGELNLPGALLLANIALVLFNLLPAFPMDGGRVLRALLALKMGRLRATEIATTLGMAIAALLFLSGLGILSLPVVGSGPMLMFVALFVFLVGQQELAAIRYQAMRPASPLDVRPIAPESAPPATPSADPRFSGFTWDAQSRLWILWHNGQPIQTISVE